MEEAINRLQKQIALLTQKVLSLIKKKPQVTEPEEVVEVVEPNRAEKEDLPINSKDMNMWIYNVAKAHIGRDMSKTQDEKGCAESVNEIVRRATGKPIGGGTSTAEMFKALDLSYDFERTEKPLEEAEEGFIILSPTGLGVGSGHVGICSDDGKIMSNNSSNSLWEENWTKQKWYDYFSKEKNFPIFCYRYKG